jgi:hypothetical protein
VLWCLAPTIARLWVCDARSRDEFDNMKTEATDEATGLVDYLAIAASEKYRRFQEVRAS